MTLIRRPYPRPSLRLIFGLENTKTGLLVQKHDSNFLFAK